MTQSTSEVAPVVSVPEAKVIGNDGIQKPMPPEKEPDMFRPVVNKREEIPAGAKTEVSETSEKVEREMFPAACATCGIAITVPFKPVATRPTFCKDCLRDYQRSAAKVRSSMGAGSPGEREKPSFPQRESVAPRSRFSERREAQSERYVPSEAPMSLSQMQHIQPKTFKPLRKKSSVNLDDVRDMIHAVKKQASEEE